MRFLIIKTSALGDIIQTFPVVKYLQKKFPNCLIDWVVEQSCSEIVEAHPLINRVLKVDTKKWRRRFLSKETRGEVCAFVKNLRREKYQAVFDLQGNIKSGLISLLADKHADIGYGFRSAPEWPSSLFKTHRIHLTQGENIRHDYVSLVAEYFQDPFLQVDSTVDLLLLPEEKERIDHFIKHHNLRNQKKVMVCPGSRWKNKCLKLETWIDLLQMLKTQEECLFIFVWGNEKEREIVREIATHFPDESTLLDRLSISGLQYVMKAMDLLLSVDSMALHLVGTTDTPSFCVFGPSSAKKYKPLGNNHVAFQGSCPYHSVFEKRCKLLRSCSTGNCMKGILREDLLQAFEEKKSAPKSELFGAYRVSE